MIRPPCRTTSNAVSSHSKRNDTSQRFQPRNSKKAGGRKADPEAHATRFEGEDYLMVQQVAVSEPEARSGLDPWKRGELPAPPMPKGLGWLGVVGPGVIVLGMSIGSGEFLLGPAAFVNHGFALLWITTVAVLLQTLFNFELMRYTLATGEPAITGFMRTKPSSGFWATAYVVMYFLQMGWPAWAGNAAASIFLLAARKSPGPEDGNVVYAIGAGTFVFCVLMLLIGKRIERTLELLNWVLIIGILGAF